MDKHNARFNLLCHRALCRVNPPAEVCRAADAKDGTNGLVLYNPAQNRIPGNSAAIDGRIYCGGGHGGLWLTRLWNGVSEWIAHNFCSLAEYPIVGLDTALHRLRFDVPQITLYKMVLDNGAHPVLWTQ